MKLPEALTIRREHFNRALLGKALIIFLFLGPILVPILWLNGWPLFTTVAEIGWNIGKGICSHTSNSFTIGGEPMMVCARCFGVTTGLLFTGLAYHYTPFIRPRLPKNRLYLATTIALFFVPWLIDSGLQRLGLWETTVWLMFPTGFLGGAALVLVPPLLWPIQPDEDNELDVDDNENEIIEIFREAPELTVVR
jgi:uncharacterized membrane protein